MVCFLLLVENQKVTIGSSSSRKLLTDRLMKLPLDFLSAYGVERLPAAMQANFLNCAFARPCSLVIRTAGTWSYGPIVQRNEAQEERALG